MRPRARERTFKEVEGDFDTSNIAGGGTGTKSNPVSDACNISAVTSTCLRTLYGQLRICSHCRVEINVYRHN
jgi:hypothetical protein